MADEQKAAESEAKLFPGLQGPTSAKANTEGDLPPSLPKADLVGLSEESKNVFTELFGKEASGTPGAMMNAVLDRQEKQGVSFFGNKPKEVLSLKKFTTHKSYPGATALQVSVLLFVLTVAAFLSQNSIRFSWFGVNPALRVDTLQNQVDELSAEVRVQSHLAAALLLDQYAGSTDEYLYNVAQARSTYSSQNKKEEFLTAAAEVKLELVELLGSVQEKLSGDVPDTALAAAILTADDLISALRAKKGSTSDQALLQDLQDLETAKALLRNQSFRALIQNLDLSELSDEHIESVYDTYNSLNASSNSIISILKSSRSEWSTILDELEAVVKSVDPLFDTEFSGNLSINDVSFGATGTVQISGDTSTSDTTNFTLVSKLIDALEESSAFQNVAERSYTKSQGEQTYTGHFRITMSLENNPTSHD